MTNAIEKSAPVNTALMEQVIIGGDLSSLSPDMRLNYYRNVCESLGLNPLTKPFEYIKLNGKLTLYARKDATDQLRKIHGISLNKPSIEYGDDVIVVSITAQARDGRTDSDVGAVSAVNLKGEARANAVMKAITKAKRRVTLSIAGLGLTDETEVDSIPGAQYVMVDSDTGEIMSKAPKKGAHSLVYAGDAAVSMGADDDGLQDENIPARVAEWLNESSPVEAAKAWAIEIGACANEHEAKNSLKKIVDAKYGGRLNRENLGAALNDFYLRQQEKLNEDVGKITVAEAEPQPAF